ncbi:MAG: hypothetical protein L6Q83_08220 [Gammaproteobacteria bacterium]|nr:hypothetical protein [Gammaproteobacteria bacterium]
MQEMARLCRNCPPNWRSFSAGLKREYERTADPALPAKICAIAVRLRRPAPAWAAAWLSAGLEATIRDDGNADQHFGFASRGRGRRTAVQRRAAQSCDDFIAAVMPAAIEHTGSPENAAELVQKAFTKNFRITLSADTVLDYWRRRLRPRAGKKKGVLPT